MDAGLPTSMIEPWSWSARLRSWSLPNMDSTKEKTRSEAAELGIIANTMRAAFAQVGMVGWLIFHLLASSRRPCAIAKAAPESWVLSHCGQGYCGRGYFGPMTCGDVFAGWQIASYYGEGLCRMANRFLLRRRIVPNGKLLPFTANGGRLDATSRFARVRYPKFPRNAGAPAKAPRPPKYWRNFFDTRGNPNIGKNFAKLWSTATHGPVV